MFTTISVRGCRNRHDKLLVGLLVLKNGQSSAVGRGPRLCPAIRAYSTEAAHYEARIDSIRNIGIIAHVDAGKTTTTERMLYHSGRTRHIGNVDHGNTTTDFLPMERQRGITIQSAAVTFQWPPKSLCPPGVEPKTVNLIDTPGHQDFRYEVDRCLPILDGAVCILDSVKGVETHTERVWESAHLTRIPRLLFVNKLDRDGASFRRSVQEAATRLKTWPLLCQIPWWQKDDLIGVIDVVHEVGLRFTPNSGGMTVVSKDSIAKENPALGEEMERARLSLLETLSEHDEEVFEEFLEHEKKVYAGIIKKSIRQLIKDGRAKFTPVFAGASLRNIGVQPLLDAVVDYLPSPDERPELRVIAGSKTITTSQLFELGVKKKGHLHNQQPVSSIAHVFKVVDDPKRGVMSWVRVYHGGLSRSSHMWNSNVHAFEKTQNIMHVSAKDYHDIQALHTGHIGAMTGLKQARTGDTLLTFPGHTGSVAPEAFRSVRIKAPETPPAVAFISIEPYTKTFGDKIEDALKRLTREDPSIRWQKDEKTEQLIVSGMGLLHLEIAQDRLLTHYKIDKESAIWGDIEVEYSETLLAPTGTHREVYDRSLRDKQGKAACSAMLEPLEECHHESLLESSVERDGNIIHISIPLPASGHLPFDPEIVRQQLLNGAIAGLARGPRRSCPVRKCTVHITFDSSTDWFGPLSTGGHITNAALFAVRAATKEAHTNNSIGILEPYSEFTILCPEEASNSIQHDIVSGRGGQVLEVKDRYATQGTGDEGSEINLEKVYVPPDPYETVQSLRGPKGKTVRMLELKGKAPLKEMMKYDGHLRSLTAGRHTLQLDPGGFELVVGHREKVLEREE